MKGKINRKKVRELENDIKQTKEKKNCNHALLFEN